MSLLVPLEKVLLRYWELLRPHQEPPADVSSNLPQSNLQPIDPSKISPSECFKVHVMQWISILEHVTVTCFQMVFVLNVVAQQMASSLHTQLLTCISVTHTWSVHKTVRSSLWKPSVMYPASGEVEGMWKVTFADFLSSRGHLVGAV